MDEKDVFPASSWTKKLWGSGAFHRDGSLQVDSDSSVDVTWVGGVGRRDIAKVYGARTLRRTEEKGA